MYRICLQDIYFLAVVSNMQAYVIHCTLIFKLLYRY